MLDVVGFDSAAPALIADFAKSGSSSAWARSVLPMSSQRMSRPRTSATRTTSKSTEVQDA